MKRKGTPQATIGERVRALRRERRWTQAQLADLLGISQNYLSDLERGRGSLSADNLLTILKTFNVPVDFFAPAGTESQDQVQNSLARFGAAHLFESAETLPSQLVKQANDAVREALVSAESPRQIAALAPVIAENINRLNLKSLQAQFLALGLGQRFGWAIENVLTAVRRELSRPLDLEWTTRYRRTEVLLKAFLSSDRPGRPLGEVRDAETDESDILDQDIASEKSLEEARRESSEISRRWGVTTRLQPDDFAEALRAAREAHR